MRYSRKKNNKRISKNNKRISRSKRRISRSKRRIIRRRTRKYRGGEASVIPFKSFGLPLGASSPREAALKIGEENNKQLYLMNKQSGGTSNSIEVPQFSPIGGIQTAYTTTDLSKLGNEVNLIGDNNAKNDCYATNSCPKDGGSRKNKKKYKR